MQLEYTQFRQIDRCFLVQALVNKHIQFIVYPLLNWTSLSTTSHPATAVNSVSTAEFSSVQTIIIIIIIIIHIFFV